jgi:hypothetical protein
VSLLEIRGRVAAIQREPKFAAAMKKMKPIAMPPLLQKNKEYLAKTLKEKEANVQELLMTKARLQAQ